MIEILRSPDQIAAIRVAGTLSGEDYDRIIYEIEAKLARHKHVGIYVDILDFSDVTAEAVAKRMRYSLAKLGQWHRFPRMAVLCNKEWMRAGLRLVSALIPGVEMRPFNVGQQNEAMDWVAGFAARSKEKPKSFSSEAHSSRL